MQSKKLQTPYEVEPSEFSKPEICMPNDNRSALKTFCKKMFKELKVILPKKAKKSNVLIKEIYKTLKAHLKNKEIYQAISFIEEKLELIKTKSNNNLEPILMNFKSKLLKFDAVALSVFKSSEYETYSNLTANKAIPYIQENFFCDKSFKLKDLEKSVISVSSSMSKTDIYDVIKDFTNLYLKSRSLPEKNKALYFVINKKNEIINADFYLNKACAFLCKHAYKNEGFKLKNGTIPVKIENKGIYNKETFRRDYFEKNPNDNRVKNYRIETINIDVSDYVNYVKSLNQKKAS